LGTDRRKGGSDTTLAEARLPSSQSSAFVGSEGLSDHTSQGRVSLNLSLDEDAKLHHQLELLWEVVPPIVVAQRVGRKVVVKAMLTAAAIG